MSSFVGNLPNSPIVVEGYSDQGSPAQQFRDSQQRAAVVQEYLQGRFQLNPKLVGSIPLGASPPESTGKADWSGVALVLLP
jgi:outer membrane protein OmpA-like peptidoglycan-associated protein